MCRAWGDIKNAMDSTTDSTVAAPAGLRFSSASLNSAPYMRAWACVISVSSQPGATATVRALAEVGPEDKILDAGPQTLELIKTAIDGARTLIWNGPLGVFEIPPFDHATVEAARFAARHAKLERLIAVAGGGDTVAALNHAGVADDFTFVSTAGGAFLEWMEGKTLPGVAALEA